jgi:hypothetical protein
MRQVPYSLAVLLFILNAPAGLAADYQIVDIRPGETVDTYFEINLSGSVFIRIETKSGPSCAEFWSLGRSAR